MNYTIDKVENGVVTVTYSDGSWAQLLAKADMTEADFDDLANQFAPKTSEAPAWLQVGQSRVAQNKPEPEPEPVPESPAWLVARQDAYGTTASQIEFITENGLEAWQAEVAAIKAANPKT